MNSIDSELLAVAIIIVVGAVLTAEYLFHGLHIFTHDTPFNHLIVAIEKELMVVGCTAFILKVVLNTSDFLEYEVFFALEFADLLVPMFSFVSSILGIALVIISQQQCHIWSKAFHVQLEEVLDEFYDKTHSWWSRLIWSPLNSGINQAEFRIYHGIFCDLFKIQRRAFEFDEYVQRVYEKFILSIIEIRLIDWALFIMFLLLNLVKTETGGKVYSCADDDLACQNNTTVILFTVSGGVLFIVTSMLVFISRHYEISILRKRGILRISDYPAFLQAMEAKEDHPAESKKMNEDDLKKVVRDAVSQRYKPSARLHLGLPLAVMSPSIMSARSSVAPVIEEHEEDALSDISKEKEIENPYITNHSDKSNDHSNNDHDDLMTKPNDENKETEYDLASVTSNQNYDLSSVASPIPAADHSDDDDKNGIHPEPPKRLIPQQSFKVGRDSFALSSDHVEASSTDKQFSKLNQTSSGRAQNQLMSTSRSVSFRRNGLNDSLSSRGSDFGKTSSKDEFYMEIPNSEKNTNRSISHFGPSFAGTRPLSKKPLEQSEKFISQKSDFIKSIFLFEKPEFFFETIQLLMTVISLYLTLWLVNFVGTEVSDFWKFISFLPAFLSTLNFVFVVKSCAILKSIYEVDQEALLEVLEQTEGSRKLAEEIREKLFERLSLRGNPKEQLKILFEEIDQDCSNALSRAEFEDVMSRLEINFSRRKWVQIFKKMDINYDDMVSFEEFFLFMFPTNDEALDMEKERINVVRSRVIVKSSRLSNKRKKITRSVRDKYLPSFSGKSGRKNNSVRKIGFIATNSITTHSLASENTNEN